MSSEKNDADMLPDYDFSKGERGKYADRALESSHVVLLDPDVADVFPTSESVNLVLRGLLPLIKRESTRARQS